MEKEMDTIPYTTEDILPHSSVFAIIKNRNGEILMQDHIKYNFWTLPGGKVKPDQSKEDALSQEIQEECNIIIWEAHPLVQRDMSYIRKEIPITIPCYLFEIITYEGEIQNNEPTKHRELRFFSVDEIQKLPYLSDVTLLYLESLWILREAKI
jgi:8-oxo-dGTP pyrophosphatase MutT (NUDIX family)